ncbi:hypothetical protein O3M35_003471 [Rhynocoris fuscipes]|uniref:CHK kinase-like domain-containing protein n=1 Tax=Rhynocoris fuscipes TaxID=488301 RepID=A0AAW1CQ34_9HEMI
MNSITNEQCNIILRNYLRHERYKIINYNVGNTSEDSLGFLSVSSTLDIKFLIYNEIKEVRFFIKFLPNTDYQLNLVKTANCFKKESAFFGELFSGIREFLSYKSIPDCYLKDNETVLVFEDLKLSGYKTCSAYDIDLKHIYAAIKSLADIHAASLLYEHKIGKTFDQIFPEEILRPWFCEINDYPGYKETLAAAKIISLIIDKYFKNYTENVINKAIFLCKKYCYFLQNKSKKYRNVITHLDLWCNNMMFKYDENGDVENGMIIDFQTYGYNPPALDLLILIYCNLERNKREVNMPKFLDFYYKCLNDNIKNHSNNPDDIMIKKEEFMASVDESLPIALASGALFIHSSIVPENELIPVISDIEKLKKYWEDDRSIVLEFMEKYENYRNRVLQTVEDLLEGVMEEEEKLKNS